mgnify:CR=1 FL=1
MKKNNIIIDTDPGVDDATALIIAMFNRNLDIKLITTTAGNVGIETTTRNALFLVEKFNKNIPVCKGAEKPLNRISKNASFIHGKEGLGLLRPTTPKILPCKEEAADKMFEIIKQNAGNITIIELAPQTNLGLLFTRHPEAEDMINEIIFEGGSPYGKEGIKPHVSFNISFDPEAANIVMNTKIKKTIVPSEIGRYISYFSKDQVEIIRKTNKTGEFLATMFDGYKSDTVIDATETNDLSAIIYYLYPQIFKTYNCDISVDLIENPGKTIIKENPNGNITFVNTVDKVLFFNKFMENLKNIKD